MAMIGRSAAVAEMGPKRYELEGPIAFTAWLGVHAALLSTTRARIEAFVEWAWDYFSEVKGDQVLDRFSQEDIDWNDDDDDPAKHSNGSPQQELLSSSRQSMPPVSSSRPALLVRPPAATFALVFTR